MINSFKNINTITEEIKRKIYRKKDTRFVIIMEKWEFIVGKEFYKKSNPIKITRDQNLRVLVNSDILLNFRFSTVKFLNKINQLVGNNKNIEKILVVQKYF